MLTAILQRMHAVLIKDFGRFPERPEHHRNPVWSLVRGVIDTHHRRVVQRMRLVPDKASVTKTYNAHMPTIPESWDAADLDEHHRLMKELDRKYCHLSEPDCPPCPLLPDCKTGRARTGEG